VACRRRHRGEGMVHLVRDELRGLTGMIRSPPRT
jgi:hypothetical protein